MFSYSWTLDPSHAFNLLDLFEEASLFEEENGLWHVEAILPFYAPDQWPDYPPPIVKKLENLSPEEWLSKAAQAVVPLTIGDFYIHTREYPPSLSHRFSLSLEAATAFGSGHHETTQGCLYLLQKVFKACPWKKALDIGCGSGILTLAMACLQPGSAWGSDCDPHALEVAKMNAQVNGIEALFFLAHGWPQGFLPSFDLVVANLFKTELIVLASSFPLIPHVILSGLLAEQEQDILQAYDRWHCIEKRRENDWVSLWLEAKTE